MEITTEFVDLDSNSPAAVIVRRAGPAVALALTLRTGGDLEVFLPYEIALAVAQGLETAASDT